MIMTKQKHLKTNCNILYAFKVRKLSFVLDLNLDHQIRFDRNEEFHLVSIAAIARLVTTSDVLNRMTAVSRNSIENVNGQIKITSVTKKTTAINAGEVIARCKIPQYLFTCFTAYCDIMLLK